MTAAAAATRSLRVGSGICLIIERDPIVTAKEVASIDHLSGGRVDFGVGAGWNREEMANHGTDPARRFGLMRERVEAMKAIWTQDEASYHGEQVDFERIWSWPKPAQRPHPPVHDRRQRPEGDRPRAALRRRLDAPARPRQRDRADRRAAAARRRGRPRPHPGRRLRRARRRPRCSPSYEEAGADRAVPGCRRRSAARSSEALERFEGAVAELRGHVSPEEARERFAGARASRAWRPPTPTASRTSSRSSSRIDGDTIYSAVDPKPKRTTDLKRLRNVAANPRVALLADHYVDDDWDVIWWARADGSRARARVLGRGAVELLRERYAQYRDAPPEGPVLAVDVERWSGWHG